LCEIFQQQSCKAFIGLTIRAKMIGGGQERIADFRSVFTRSDSAVTLSEKSSINTINALSSEPNMNIVRCP